MQINFMIIQFSLLLSYQQDILLIFEYSRQCVSCKFKELSFVIIGFQHLCKFSINSCVFLDGGPHTIFLPCPSHVSVLQDPFS